MISDFLVSHPSGPFFYLNENELNKAIQKYPSLLNHKGVDYVEKTCTGSIIPGYDSYFSNETILDQFERLFQMLEFKEAYKGCEIEIVVDNARTHTAQTVNINEFW